MDHSRSFDPALDDPLAVADTTPEAVGPSEADDPDADRDDRDDRDDRSVGLDADSLQRLTATQPAIEQAKGMLMGYYGIDADRAFALLSRWSSERHVKVRELARGVVDVASVPDPQPFGALRRLLEQGPPA